jgi:hypothetical protein
MKDKMHKCGLPIPIHHYEMNMLMISSALQHAAALLTGCASSHTVNLHIRVMQRVSGENGEEYKPLFVWEE